MSTFTVKKNIDRATQFAGDNFGKAMQNKTKLSFTTYNDQTLVYCNQPEAVLAKHFVGSSAATTNYYVNRSSRREIVWFMPHTICWFAQMVTLPLEYIIQTQHR